VARRPRGEFSNGAWGWTSAATHAMMMAQAASSPACARVRAQEPVAMMTQTVPEPGQMAPDFKLRGPGGAFYTLSEHRGESPVVLVFFPLAFSAVCSHQLPEMQKRIPAFEQAGAVVYGISVDSHHANAAFARSLGLTFPLLSDWKHEVSSAYGVMIPEAGYSGRATFVVGKDGKLLWREISEETNSLEQVPSPERALAALPRA
jgi:peroxiredoxin